MICLNKIGKEDMLSDGPKIPQWFCAVYGGVLSKIFTVDSGMGGRCLQFLPWFCALKNLVLCCAEQFRAVVSSLVEVRNKFSLKTSFICAIIASSLKDVPSELVCRQHQTIRVVVAVVVVSVEREEGTENVPNPPTFPPSSFLRTRAANFPVEQNGSRPKH